MAVEIERKFLVKDASIVKGLTGVPYRQGYIAAEGATVRVRIAGEIGYLTIKGPSSGISRTEYEYRIPVADAEAMLDSLCLPSQIEKTRYVLPLGAVNWEIDVFSGANAGLVLAEVELENERQQVELPPWLGEEVSSDPRYYNANLARHPCSQW